MIPRRAHGLPSAAALALLLGTSAVACYFDPFPWPAEEPDVRADRLCVESAAPDDAPDTTFIDCDIEGARLGPRLPDPSRQFLVMAWNIERGFGVDGQLDAILNDPDVPVPDVVLLSEVDRGCRRTDYRNIAREWAEALGYYYVYATEFVELPSDRGLTGPYDPPLCEHGNAIVSRWPLGNVRQIRHAANRSWYTPPDHPNPDEPRLGGRIAVAADMWIGSRLVRLYSLHLESELTTPEIRDAQAAEIVADAASIAYPVIIGGDFNTVEAVFILGHGSTQWPIHQSLIGAGFSDAHAGLAFLDRPTSLDPLPLVIDFIYTRGLVSEAAEVCPVPICGGLSDHLPVWTRVEIPRPE